MGALPSRDATSRNAAGVVGGVEADDFVMDGVGGGDVADREEDGHITDGGDYGDVTDGEEDGDVTDGDVDGDVMDGREDGGITDGEVDGDTSDGGEDGDVSDGGEDGDITDGGEDGDDTDKDDDGDTDKDDDGNTDKDDDGEASVSGADTAVDDEEEDGHVSDGDEDNDASDNVLSPATTKTKRLCWRLPPVAGRGRWVIAGPVISHVDIDPLRFTTAIVVEALPEFSSREVYARAAHLLVAKGMYTSMVATHESLLHVREEYDPCSTPTTEPSWDLDLNVPEGVPVRRVLDRASSYSRRTKRRVPEGYVKFIGQVPLSTHPWYAYGLRLLSRRDERRGAVAYRRAMGRLMDDDERRLLRAGNSSALTAVRHATTYNLRTAADKAKGLRPTKKRPWRHVAPPDLIPARKRLIAMKRRVFERCSRVRHSMIVIDKHGDAIPWAYVLGSGLSGVRLYQSRDGTVKRLACHSHKQRKDASGSAAAASGAGAASAAATDGHAEVPEQEADGDQPLGAEVESSLSAEELGILRSSTLEYADGTGAEKVIAVEFDVVAGIQASIAQRTLRCSVEDVVNSAAAWSLPADGGPVRRSALTLFTITLAASWLAGGRTSMVPVLYILAGEHNIHSALGSRLDSLVAAAVRATYSVRVHATSGIHGDESDDASTSADSEEGAAAEESFCDWTGPAFVKIVGDFSLVSHMLGLTGGSDDSRCPFWWPCSSKTFLSLTEQAKAPGFRRTVRTIARQWELVCWFLARWCGLRGGLALDSGTVCARCVVCREAVPLVMPLERYVCCGTPFCAGSTTRAADTLPVILPTPLKRMFNRVRRRAGGVRGYPVLRTIPVIVQVPVLHCTGNLVKKLLFFFLAELGEAPKAVAKRGINSVTGRDGLKLYMREYIKLIALILACEDIVSVAVESAMLSMWSLALLMTAAWRQALTAPMVNREKAVAVMELAVGLLAPLWSALKPLDKESKAGGVTSLYLHAVLAHARDSLGQHSPVRAVVTDDHAEGNIREMSKHCKTRINNVARAQGVTELQALADEDDISPSRGQFAAELRIYTTRVEVCACCTTSLRPTEAADITRAISRAKESGLTTEERASSEDTSSETLLVPAALVHDDDAFVEQDGPGKAWLSKERKVARALSDRLATLKVCLCGAARQMEAGSIARRLHELRHDGDDVGPSDDVMDAVDDREGAADIAPTTQRASVPRTRQDGVTVDDARTLMVQHSIACRDSDVNDCDGQCRQGGIEGTMDDDVRDGDSDCAADGDCAADWMDRLDDRDDDEDVPGAAADSVRGNPPAENVPMLASDIFNDPELSRFAPPVELLRPFFAEDHAPIEPVPPADADAYRDRLAEEDMLLRLFSVRMRQGPFVAWATSQGVHLHAVYEAVGSVTRKLNDLRAAGLGAHASTL